MRRDLLEEVQGIIFDSGPARVTGEITAKWVGKYFLSFSPLFAVCCGMFPFFLVRATGEITAKWVVYEFLDSIFVRFFVVCAFILRF